MAEQLFHIGIKALIRNEQGELFLLNEPDTDGNARWDIPGGRMDAGETFEQTLARELNEELSVTYTEIPQFLTAAVSNITIKTDRGVVGLVLMAYQLHIKQVSAIRPAEQGARHEWVTPRVAAERLARKYPPNFCKIISKL